MLCSCVCPPSTSDPLAAPSLIAPDWRPDLRKTLRGASSGPAAAGFTEGDSPLVSRLSAPSRPWLLRALVAHGEPGQQPERCVAGESRGTRWGGPRRRGRRGVLLPKGQVPHSRLVATPAPAAGRWSRARGYAG